jgi:hypothetical protein
MASPHRPPIRLVAAGLVAIVGFVLPGCGGGGGSDAVSTTLVTGPVNTTVPAPGQNQMRAIVVQPSDLPANWKASPASPSSDPRIDSAALARCMGTLDTLPDAAALAFSQNFSDGSSIVSSEATSFRSAVDVQADAASLINPMASDCLAKVGKVRLPLSLPKAVTVKSLTLKITPGSGGGPPNVIATATGTFVLTTVGHQLTLKNEVVFLVGRRIEAQIAFFTTGAPFPAQVKAEVIRKVAARVAHGS